MIKLNGKTVLDIEIENLMACRITDIIITTGYKEMEIKNYIDEKYSNLGVTFVENKKYRSTNYIYSMWLTRELIDDNIILLHGDVVFEKKLLERLINDGSANSALVNNEADKPEKDFKAVVKEDIITKIGVNFSGDNAFFCAPVYKFSRQSFVKWLAEIELFIKKGNVNCYAEDAFNRISEEIRLSPVYYTDEFCMEIDTPDDIGVAREYYNRNNRINVKAEQI